MRATGDLRFPCGGALFRCRCLIVFCTSLPGDSQSLFTSRGSLIRGYRSNPAPRPVGPRRRSLRRPDAFAGAGRMGQSRACLAFVPSAHPDPREGRDRSLAVPFKSFKREEKNLRPREDRA